MGHATRRQIAGHWLNHFSSQKCAQVGVRVACEKLPQVLATGTVNRISAQQALNRIRDFGGEAAIANWPGNRLMQPNRSAEAEVVSVLHAVADFQFLAFDPDVGNPVLAAAVGASGDVQLEVLLEARQPVFQFFDQPAGKTLGFSDREFAELSAAAGNGSTKERRAADAQSDRVQLFRERFRLQSRHVNHQQILHVGGAQLAVCEPICEIGSVAAFGLP